MIATRRQTRRSGITLTEILISIMIMGIGFVSVAALFPVALMRMRDATRASRSTMLAETAANEVNARDLLNGESFVAPGLSWYGTRYGYPSGSFPFAIPAFTSFYLPSPWNKDIVPGGEGDAATAGVWAMRYQPGLPVAYDPTFWSTVHYNTYDAADPGAATTPATTFTAGTDRFGRGIGILRNDGDDNPPPAHGLQRITNFLPYVPYDSTAPYNLAPYWPLTYALPGQPGAVDVASDALTSVDDPIFTDTETGEQNNSPLVPVNFLKNGIDDDGDDLIDEADEIDFQRTWDFTYMLTARQAAAGDSSTYEADVVLFHKRPIGFELAAAPTAGGQTVVPSGERTVEAVWGHTNSTDAIAPIGTTGTGYSIADDRVVLLRWQVATPDPLVRVGDFIADVTYERVRSRSIANFSALYRGQRCHWYRIEQVSDIEPDPAIPGHRRMIIRVDTPVKAKTRLTTDGDGQVVPVVPEAALLCPYVVNVYSTILYSRQ